MFEIRDDQMQMMGRTIYIDRVANFLTAQFPEAAQLEQSELRREVTRQVEKAESYGFRTERHVAKYVVTAWLMGVDFDTEFAAAVTVLASEELVAEEKAEWLRDWTTAIFTALENG